MSNFKTKKIILLLIFFPFQVGLGAIAQEEDSLQSRANLDYLYGNYSSAVQSYAQLIENGNLDEVNFYRLAYLHEQLKEYPESIFYLRKLYWNSGDPLVRDKIASLLEQETRSIPEGDPSSNWTTYTLHHRWWFFGGIGVLLGLAFAGLFIKKWNGRTIFSVIASGLAVIVAFFLVLSWQLSEPRAVIVLPTYFYETPSYGATQLSLPLSAGSTVILRDTEDIWQEIEVDQVRAWVPVFSLAPLNEWE